MYRKDQIKGIVAIILFGVIGISYAILGEEIAKGAAIAGIIIWFTSMYFLNKKKF
jgi:hypothetical protein